MPSREASDQWHLESRRTLKLAARGAPLAGLSGSASWQNLTARNSLAATTPFALDSRTGCRSARIRPGRAEIPTANGTVGGQHHHVWNCSPATPLLAGGRRGAARRRRSLVQELQVLSMPCRRSSRTTAGAGPSCISRRSTSCCRCTGRTTAALPCRPILVAPNLIHVVGHRDQLRRVRSWAKLSRRLVVHGTACACRFCPPRRHPAHSLAS